MRNKTFCFLFLSLLLWAVVTYFILFHKSDNTAEEQLKLAKQLDALQKELDELISTNSRLIGELTAREARKASSKNLLSNSVDLRGKKKIFSSSVDTEQEKNAVFDFAQVHNLQNQTQEFFKEHSRASKTLYEVPKSLLNGSPVIPVLVISCNRVSIKRCLDQLIKYRPNAEQFPIIVSQDCGHQQTHQVIESYKSKIFSIQQPDQSDIDVPLKEKKFKGYFKIARHYGWALNQTFFEFKFNSVIIVEDDLDVAPDFFDYFLGTHPILEADPTLWCVSAWNDNGKPNLVDTSSPHLLYRTDFFPGLGWMLTKSLWQELAPKWPRAYWDDWIRQPEQRKERACIRPELSRTRTFGKIGVSNGMFYEKHLKFIYLNEQKVPFADMNLTYLLKTNYDSKFENEVYKSKVITYEELKAHKFDDSISYRIPYYTRQFYKATTKILGLMDDFKSGVPRTGYRGVVTFFYTGRRIHLAPGTSWTGYDPTWS